MTTTNLMLASGVLPALQQFVSATILHFILVDFTAALVPISVASDVAARFFKNEPLRHTAWWTLFSRRSSRLSRRSLAGFSGCPTTTG